MSPAEIFLRPVFCWPRAWPRKAVPVFGKDHAQGLKEAVMPASSKTYRPETRLVHAGTLRSQFGETSEALFLTQGYVYPTRRGVRGALLRKDPGLRLFALLEPDHEHVRAAHGRARRRGGRALDRDRHGGGDDGAHGPRAGRRSRRRGQGAVRLVPLGDRGMAAAFRRHLDAGQRHRSRRVEKGDAAKTPRRSSWKRRPTRRSR